MTFGERLKAVRTENRKTQQEVADAIGKGRSTIAGYEVDDRLPDFETLKKLSEYFCVPSDYLLGVEISEEKPEYKLLKKTLDVTDMNEAQIKELENFKSFLKSRDNKKK